ncbi:zinc ribbon domain-containing protein [Microcoleus sp. T2B6]|uniref:zinc ribbon domain-containing protein n=1 Tax=Microcoleus sp. T2B6 TaxID=3055424 RepID=UPI002FD21599
MQKPRNDSSRRFECQWNAKKPQTCGMVIADCGFHEFKRQLEYKAKKFGCKVIVADRWFSSTKTCSNCGLIQDMPLKERTYNCGSCGHSMDRDLNAAIMLSRLAKS